MKTKMIVLFLFVGLFNCCTIEKTITNPAYAIGKIDSYDPGKAGFAASVIFEYDVNRVKYINSYSNGLYKGWKVPSQAAYKSGNQFMVEYDLNNVKTARMLFDYPVKDSTDYKKYVEEFKINPPK